MDLEKNLMQVMNRITTAEQKFQRPLGSVTLLPVSKRQDIKKMQALIKCGNNLFGENRAQEALQKIIALSNPLLEWHFIAPIQSNKTKEIAQNFSWAHCLASEKAAIRLNEQRPSDLPPLNVCIQVNISEEPQKNGITPAQLSHLAAVTADLPNLKLRGLMCIPLPTNDFQQQRKPFAQLRSLLDNLNAKSYSLDTLSMGMSSDLEAAIAEGSTIVRVGTDIFGPRA